MSLWDIGSSVLQTAFKNTDSIEPTRADEKREQDTISTAATHTEQSKALKKPLQKPENKKSDLEEVKHSDLGTWIDAGADMLGQVSKTAESALDGSLLDAAEEAASTGLAALHGKVDVNLDASEPVLAAVDKLSHPTVNFTLGLSEQTMMLSIGMTVFLAFEMWYLMR